MPLAKKRTIGVTGSGRGGGAAKKGEGETLGGWGGAKCANWLTGSAVTLAEGAAKERRWRTLTTIGVGAFWGPRPPRSTGDCYRKAPDFRGKGEWRSSQVWEDRDGDIALM